MRLPFFGFSLLVLAAFTTPVHAESKSQLWLYYPTNFGVEKNVDDAEKIWKRAAAAGYTHVLIADSKFARLEQMYPDYFKNCDRARKIAADLKMQLVPALFSIGYSNDILAQDPNLAEGVPVKDSLFVVKDGVATVLPDPAIKFGKVTFKDDKVSVAGNIASLAEGKGVGRMVYHLTVPKFHAYHISVKVKTKDFPHRPEIKVISDDADLQWQYLKVEPTQDWKQCDVIFDSLNHTEINIYFGVWDDSKGSLQWKDWSIEEIGLVNVLRRPGAPCIVKDEASGKTLAEGTDYEPIVDPKLGNDPYSGQFISYHAPAPLRTKLADGTRLLVSWYYPPIIYDEQVPICISEPKTKALLADQAKRMKALWKSPLYMMSHDEFRICNWDESCESRKQTPGQMLAENIKYCTDLLQPQQAVAWNDMFDPFHNAVKGPYYLVNGPWTGSWEGLSKEVLVANWNYGKRDESLKFFADRGNPQIIAGFYDNDLSEFANWIASGKKVTGVRGYMYTTWRGDYSKLEQFAEMALK